MDPTLQQFRTNLNCGGCVRGVTPFLDDLAGVTRWEVDFADERKVLSVAGTATAAEITAAVREAGFDAEPLP